MSYNWLGIFRQGSWYAYRSYLLQQRREVNARVAVINAELKRIGTVTVLYGETQNEDGTSTITEERIGFLVSQGSTLEKLLQAYVALGGNPFDISLFLSPDSVIYVAEKDMTIETQPYGGVIYPKSGNYAPGDIYEGGYLVVKKYLPARMGGRKEVEDQTVAGLVAQSRGWINQTLRERCSELENRIIKQCDLREQLLKELEEITFAVGGTMGVLPTLDEDAYNVDLGVAKIVAAIDSVFYETDGYTPDFETVNVEMLSGYPFLLDDIEPEENNTAL